MNQRTNRSQPDSEGHLVTWSQQVRGCHLGVTGGDLCSPAGLGPGQQQLGRRPHPTSPTDSEALCCHVWAPVQCHVAQAPAANLPYFPLTKFPGHLFFHFFFFSFCFSFFFSFSPFLFFLPSFFSFPFLPSFLFSISIRSLLRGKSSFTAVL